MIKNEVKELWKLCFPDDNPEFVELYFRMRYNNGVNLAIRVGEDVVSALQMLPYPMTFCSTQIDTAYISGACTHPDFRRRGAMRELLAQAFAQMRQRGVLLSTLIPATESLAAYYAHSGYAPVFGYAEQTFAAGQTAMPKGTEAKEETVLDTDAYDYVDRKMHERPCCLQHTAADMRVVMAELPISHGCAYTLRNGNALQAFALFYPAGKGLTCAELLADNDKAANLLLNEVCRRHGLGSVRLLRPAEGDEPAKPLGMARIIDATTVLRLYAAAHPQLDVNIALTDPQLTSNSGFYYLNNGKCMRSAERLRGTHLNFDIAGLAAYVLTPLHPYMSLMLN